MSLENVTMMRNAVDADPKCMVTRGVFADALSEAGLVDEELAVRVSLILWKTNNSRLRTALRRICGVENQTAIPVGAIEGRATPHLIGKDASLVNLDGSVIWYPHGYRQAVRRAAYTYFPSTLKVVAGAEWIVEHLLTSPRIDPPT